MAEPIWRPSEKRIESANITEFARLASEQNNFNKDELYQWSWDKPEEFWPALSDYAGIIYSKKWDSVLVNGET